MNQQAPLFRKKTSKALIGFVLVDVDTLIFGPVNERAPSRDALNFDLLRPSIMNRLKESLHKKTNAQAKWCLKQLIKEALHRKQTALSYSGDHYFYEKLELLLIDELHLLNKK